MTAISTKRELLCRDINLLEIFDNLNRKYFDGKCCAGIGWRNIRIGAKHQTLGVCELTERFIRINRVLSDIRVPLKVLEFTVYHEMVHLMVGVKHDDKFLEMERKFEHYDECVKFEQEVLPSILEEWRIHKYGNK